MFTFFVGEDTQKAKKALRKELDAAKEANPNALVSRFDDVNFDAEKIREALGAVSLFGGGGNIIALDGLSADEEGKIFLEEELFKFADTENNVFVREEVIPKAFIAKFGKAGKVHEFLLAKKFIAKTNNFVIADALLRKDKRGAWVEFEKSRRRGDRAEEVHGTIFWAVKTLYMCATKPKAEALAFGMKEFTYRKYLEGAKHFLVRDLEEKLGELKEMYHRAHRGEGELDVFLEQFLLRL